MTVIVITGASQGIGAEVAYAFAAKFNQASVIHLLARSEENLLSVAEKCQQSGASVTSWVCDVTDDAQVAECAKKILAQGSAPAVLVNNAGSYAPSSFVNPALHISGDEFRAQINVNVTSAFLVTQAFLPAMLEQKSGDVFFLCSIASLHAYPNSMAYTVAKHGLLGLARSLRVETQKKGIRVSALLLGAVDTPAWGAAPGVLHNEFIPAADIARTILAIHQLERQTTVDEVIIRPQWGDVPSCTDISRKSGDITMNTMSYKGYAARIEYSDEDDCFVGHIAGINDIVGFHGDSVSELHAAFEEAVDDYLETCKKAGRPPQKPYSGHIMLRVPPELHAKAAMMAEAHGKSLNSWVTELLSSAD